MVLMGDGHSNYDLIIVGAGPAGSYASARFSELGYRVLLVDRKHEVGRPVQCAGLVNSRLFDLPGLGKLKDGTILRSIRGADVFSPSGNMLPLRGKENKAFSIDRARFDHELLISAAEMGSSLMLKTELRGIRILEDGSAKVGLLGPGGEMNVSAPMVLACDGPGSTLRSMLRMAIPKETIPGVSMELELRSGELPSERVAVLTGSRTASGFFAWIIPSYLPNGFRLGLSALTGEGLRSGMEKLFLDTRVTRFLSLEGPLRESSGSISTTFGSVPMGQPKEISKGPVLLLGDAAGMAKPTSGGGIYPALMAVDSLTRSLNGDVKPGVQAISNFLSSWKKGYGKELARTFVLRRIIKELKDEEMDIGLRALSDEKNLKIINEKGDIDHPVQLAVGLLRSDPSLLALIPRFVPHLRGLFI